MKTEVAAKFDEKREEDIIKHLMDDLTTARAQERKLKLLCWVLSIGVYAMLSVLALGIGGCI